MFDGISEVEEISVVRTRVWLAGGLPVLVLAASPDRFADVLLSATGSEGHLAELEQRAAGKGIMFEAGRLRTRDAGIPASSEEEIYAALDLPFIAPELREGRGEVAAAAAGEIPALIEGGDLRGVLHVHTDWSDGAETLETMAEAARERGYEYLGIADHSRSAGYAGGLSAERLAEQGAAISALNNKWKDFRILHGVESDILPDGSLDYDRKDLARLDFVVASVHGSFSQDRETMTRRIIAAMEDPMTRVLGHPTGRLLLGRDPYEVDMDAVLEAAARLGVMIEINANPYRLDLDWRHLPRCRELGIRILINPDAHGIDGLGDVDYGIGVARKGGLGKEMVANCLPVEELAALWKRE
jgi:DNA polymerase (family 10)